MPIYEYQCQDCKNKFEMIRMMKDADAPVECKSCHSKNTKRAISVFFSKCDNRSTSSSGSGCSGCHGGSCSTCSH